MKTYQCPFCNHLMEKSEDSAKWYCFNKSCCFRFVDVHDFVVDDMTKELEQLKEYAWRYKDLNDEI